MGHLAGKAGDVYVADLLLEDCEDSWNSGTNGVATGETTIVKVGDGSAKCTIGSGIQVGDVIMYETMSSGTKDLRDYTHLLLWAYSVPTTELLDYRIGIGTEASGANPTTVVDIPALTALTWKYCHCTVISGKPFTATSVGSIIGLESNANGANTDVIILDDIRAAKLIEGIKSWSLDYTSDPLETTDFANAGIKAYIIGGSNWSGTFEGYKEGVPLTIGSEYGLELAESSTVAEMWLGNAIITGVHPTAAIDGIVSYSYDFQGTGVLTVASA